MTVAGFCLVQGKSTARGTLGTLLGTPQPLRLKGLLQYWKALHLSLLCMFSHLLLDFSTYSLLHFLSMQVPSSFLLLMKFSETWICDGLSPFIFQAGLGYLISWWR